MAGVSLAALPLHTVQLNILHESIVRGIDGYYKAVKPIHKTGPQYIAVDKGPEGVEYHFTPA